MAVGVVQCMMPWYTTEHARRDAARQAEQTKIMEKLPLDDDGAALRLAVKHGLCLDLRFDQAWVGQYPIEQGCEGIVEPFGDDANAATRRAIVRAWMGEGA